VQTLPLLTGGTDGQFVQGGSLGDAAARVAISGPAAICFNSMGRQASATAGITGVGAACDVDPAAPTTTYDISISGGDRPLRVTVSIGGRIRMCDPARTLSSTTPDGCPAS
jgi:type IV fimbrial biogenesis protein FimT